MAIGRFYGGVAALIHGPGTDKYLVLRRAAAKDVGAGAWECITGRVDQGEGLPQAAIREVREELGVEARVEMMIGTMHFYRGEAQPENELIGVSFLCSVDDVASIQVVGSTTSIDG